jgi:hypothetical protein
MQVVLVVRHLPFPCQFGSAGSAGLPPPEKNGWSKNGETLGFDQHLKWDGKNEAPTKFLIHIGFVSK